eukprot:gene8442-9930_t
MSEFLGGTVYTQFSLATGDVLVQHLVNQTHPVHIVSLLQCSGDDFLAMVATSVNADNNYLNISSYNSASNTFTTKGHFPLDISRQVGFQYNSVDIPSGLAFSTFCLNGNAPGLVIFDLNKQTSSIIHFSGVPCSMNTIGAYDSPNQIYYLYGDMFGLAENTVTFGVYSLADDSISYVDIPYTMGDEANLQQIFLYKSTLYACIIQHTYTGVFTVDFNTKTATTIFNFDTKDALAQYTFNPDSGYIVGLVNSHAYYINLNTLEITNNLMANLTYQIIESYDLDMFCPQ